MITAAAIALVGTGGVYLLVTAAAPSRPHCVHQGVRRLSLQAATSPKDLLVASGLAAIGAAAATAVVFGALLPALGVGVAAAWWPIAAAKARALTAAQSAAAGWPRLIEEIALLAGSLGYSVPAALFEAGSSAPAGLRPAFEAAHRHWLMSTDLEASLAILTSMVNDPTADATCETLLVAHEVGGSDLPRRLAALVEDRTDDLEARRDVQARQAGARFARRFVLVVPAGMALAGLAIGDGRAAYATPGGQVAASAGVAMVVACWIWSGRIMAPPRPARMFGA